MVRGVFQESEEAGWLPGVDAVRPLRCCTLCLEAAALPFAEQLSALSGCGGASLIAKARGVGGGSPGALWLDLDGSAQSSSMDFTVRSGGCRSLFRADHD